MDDPNLRTRTAIPVVAERLQQETTAASAVSWAAIFAGAAGAAALSLILLVLGTGLGLSAVSPWSSQGVSAPTFGVSTILWISFTALVASGLGGYLAGRLRTRWVGTHADEVYFRDTAHGFLAWAVSTLVTAGLLTSAIGSVLTTGVEAGGSALAAAGTAAAGTATTAAAAGAGRSMQGPSGSTGSMESGQAGYFVDSLFRPTSPAGAASSPTDASSAPVTPSSPTAGSPTPEVARIFARSLQGGTLAQEDSQYVAQLVAQRTGLSAQDAQKRVNDVYAKTQATIKDAEAKAKEAADKVRQASAYGALWLFVSLLLGAFAASLMATFGGRQRDL